MSAPTKKHIYVRKLPGQPHEVVPPSWRRHNGAEKEISHYVHSDLFDEVIGERDTLKFVLRTVSEEMVAKIVSGYTLYMAALRDPRDIARNKDRDSAVEYLIRDGILTEEQLHLHISTSVKTKLAAGNL